MVWSWMVLAAAAAPWSVSVFEAPEGFEEEADSFRVLMEGALRAEGTEVRPLADRSPCGDPRCAGLALTEVPGGTVVFGRLRRFGAKLIVSAEAVGQTQGTAQMVIDQVEDLDAAAQRIVLSLLTGVPPDRTVELGTVTAAEEAPDRRKDGARGLSFAVGPIAPLAGTLGQSAIGVAIDLGYWFETRHFAVEPLIGARFSVDRRDDRRFLEIPLDIGMYWIPSLGDFSPFIGGGGGIRYISARRPATLFVGETIQTRHDDEERDSGAAFALFGRAGVLLLRTYALRVSVSARYGVSFIDLNGAGYAQSITGLMAVHF
jgi:hypothetical protein